MSASALNPTLERWFLEYTAAHRHPTNRLTHKIAIPVIVFHIIAMLDWVKLPVDVGGVALSAGHLVYVAAVLFYLRLHFVLGVVMAALMFACFPLAALTPKPVVVALAIGGWLIQLAGHVVWEKNQPAFMKNLLQALIGPMFFVAVLLRIWRPRYAPTEAGAAA